MAVTLGQVRIAILKTAHGAGYDLELLTQRINDRYFEYLNSHPWTRLYSTGTITVVDAYDTGTLAITNGATAVTLTDGSFPSNLSGGRLRVGTDSEWYVFTRTAATTGTIDRAYEADTVTEATYKLWQPIYSLPTDTDIVESISVPSQGWELDQISPEQLDEVDPSREEYGHPRTWTQYSDSSNVARIELWPGPEEGEGLPVRYRTAGTRFTFSSPSTEFPNWVDTNAIVAGVEADILAEKGLVAQAQIAEAKWNLRLTQAKQEDCQRMAPGTLTMTDRYTAHRWDREIGDYRLDRRATLLRSL